MKKNINLLIAIFVVGLAFIVGMGNVDASVRFADCTSVHYTSAYYTMAKAKNANLPYSSDNSFSALYRTSDKRVVYCTELGRTLVSASAGAPSESYKTVTATSGKELWYAKVIGYGFNGKQGSSDKCSSKRIATQMLVHMISKQGTGKTAGWRSYSESQIKKYFTSKTSSSKKSDIAKQFVQIRKNALASVVEPSFKGKTVTLVYDINTKKWTGSITDSNKALSEWWTVSDKGGLESVTKSTNTLKLVANSNTAKSGTIKLKRTVPSPKIHVSTYTTSKHQRSVYVDAGTTTIYVNLKYKVADVQNGTVTVEKRSSYDNQTISGATYGIYSDNACTTKAKDYQGTTLSEKTTDASGIVSWTNLYYADAGTTYYVKELVVPEGYVVSESDLIANSAVEGCVPVLINSSQKIAKKTLQNNPYGNITILKLDAKTLKALKGIKFRLYDESGTNPAKDVKGDVLGEAVTDDNGYAGWDAVPYGKYVIKEVSESTSYYKDGFYLLGSENPVLKNTIEFTLNEETDAAKIAVSSTSNVKNASIELVNEPIDMKISKKEIGGSEEIPGAKIVIKDKTGKVVEEWTSTSETKIIYIPTGEYTLTETVAPDGYKELNTTISFKVDKDGKVTATGAKSNVYKIEESEDGDIDHLTIFNELIKKKKVQIPNTASYTQTIGLVAGVVMLSIGGYLVYRKFLLPHEVSKK